MCEQQVVLELTQTPPFFCTYLKKKKKNLNQHIRMTQALLAFVLTSVEHTPWISRSISGGFIHHVCVADPVSLSHLMVTLIHIMYQHSETLSCDASPTGGSPPLRVLRGVAQSMSYLPILSHLFSWLVS